MSHTAGLEYTPNVALATKHIYERVKDGIPDFLL